MKKQIIWLSAGGLISAAAALVSLADPIPFPQSGTYAFDFETDPLGTDAGGKPVFLRDIWPSEAEIAALVEARTRGLTRFIGYSGDGDDAYAAVASGIFDVLETSVNIAD